jgi:hypothetical protein
MFIALAIAVLIFSAGVRAQQPPPAELPLKVELLCPAPCTFRQGKSIWLDLDYTASESGYSVLTNYTDRDIAQDEFIPAPQEGTSDPVAPYMSIIRPGGGSFGFRRVSLTERPVTVRMNLNQWIRFDRPGEHHIRTISHRVTDTSRPREAVRPKSNEVVIRIVAADAQWQREQLSRILRALDAVKGIRISVNTIPDAVRALCDLGTEEAAIEMARRMGVDRDTGWRLYSMGLIRSPFKASGIREMERLLTDPDVPNTDLFL